MRRILHTIDTTGPGGAETVFVNLIRGLDREQYQPYVALFGEGWVSEQIELLGIKPHYFKATGGCSLSYLWELVRCIRQNKIDLIQSHLLGSNLYCSMAGTLCNTPVYSTFHGFVDSGDNHMKSRIKGALIRMGSRKVIFVSDKLRKDMGRDLGLPPGRTATIYNGVDIHRYASPMGLDLRAELGLGVDQILIGAVGNIRPAKGYAYLLDAAKTVCNRRDDCHFVIAGEGSGALYETLLAKRKSLGLEKRVHFLGFRPDVAAVLQNYDVFVLPSISEGFSISTIEALSCGIPVVATRSGGPEEIISSGQTGLLVAKESGAALADGVLELLETPTLRDRVRSTGLKHVAQSFSLESMVEQYRQAYEET